MYTWSTGASAVLQHTGVDWDGIWSLPYAAGKAAFCLSLQLPLGVGAELAYAAMDICEARDEIGWAHPAAPMTAIAVDLGPIGRVVDLPATTVRACQMVCVRGVHLEGEHHGGHGCQCGACGASPAAGGAR